MFCFVFFFKRKLGRPKVLRAENCSYYKDQGWEVEQRIVTRVRKMGELLKTVQQFFIKPSQQSQRHCHVNQIQIKKIECQKHVCISQLHWLIHCTVMYAACKLSFNPLSPNMRQAFKLLLDQACMQVTRMEKKVIKDLLCIDVQTNSLN